MKKVAIVLVVIMVIGLLAGGAYALSDGFKKVPWEKNQSTETNILTESKDLLNNHASITFGTGDTAWTISTADKLEPIYIDDLRAKGKGLFIGESYGGSPSETRPTLTDVNIEGANLINVSISGQSNSEHVNYLLSREKDAFIWNACSDKIYKNILYACNGDNYDYDALEARIKAQGYQSGDNYLLGAYTFLFEFKNIAKYGESSLLGAEDLSALATGTIVTFNIPVYYRVK